LANVSIKGHCEYRSGACSHKRGDRRFWRKEGIGKGAGEVLRQSHTIGKKPIDAVKPPT
jgi:hypothetical protein